MSSTSISASDNLLFWLLLLCVDKSPPPPQLWTFYSEYKSDLSTSIYDTQVILKAKGYICNIKITSLCLETCQLYNKQSQHTHAESLNASISSNYKMQKSQCTVKNYFLTNSACKECIAMIFWPSSMSNEQLWLLISLLCNFEFQNLKVLVFYCHTTSFCVFILHMLHFHNKM